jgi:antitoxin YefM
MPTETTYTHARANFAALCKEAISTREPIIIRRRGAEDVALVAAAELRGLMETAYLLRSPKNAERLLAALAQSRSESLPAESLEGLRRELGLGETR